MVDKCLKTRLLDECLIFYLYLFSFLNLLFSNPTEHYIINWENIYNYIAFECVKPTISLR